MIHNLQQSIQKKI